MATVTPLEGEITINDDCQWCEPQKCYEASFWWGEILFAIYTTVPSRIASGALPGLANQLLELASEALGEPKGHVMPAELMKKEMGFKGLPIVYVNWTDFRPGVFLCARRSITLESP